MNHYSRILFIAVFCLFAVAAQAQTKEVVIKLGFDCDHFVECETGQSRLEKHLMYTKGIKVINFSPETGTVKLQFNTKQTTEQKIREAIAKAGYAADDVKADPKGYAKLDPCCRKDG